jgi:uncharacterized protein
VSTFVDADPAIVPRHTSSHLLQDYRRSGADPAQGGNPMKGLFAALAALFLGALAMSSSAQAASFDCAKAAKPDEIAICKTQVLSDLDMQMATLYGVRMQIPMLMGAKGAALDEQRAFLAQRAACGGNVACIQPAYLTRIAVLNQAIQTAMHDYCIKLGICG